MEKDGYCPISKQGIRETANTYIADFVEDRVVIPKSYEGKVLISSGKVDRDISVKLPKEAEFCNGILEPDGTVKYSGRSNADISIKSQAVVQQGIPLIEVDARISIQDSTAPQRYSFEYNLPSNYRMLSSEDYYNEQKDMAEINDMELEQGWIYILNADNEMVAVIEPAAASDSVGHRVDTHYELRGTTITQVIDFDSDTIFPITATTTSTKPSNHKIGDAREYCKIDYSVIGAASFVSGTGYSVLTDAAKTKIKKAIVAKVGSKFIPIINIASWAVEGYAVLRSLQGYSYTSVLIDYEIWAIYKHQGGRWVEGRQYKNSSVYCTLVK